MTARLTHRVPCDGDLPLDESFFRFRDTKRPPMNGTAEESGKQEVLVIASREFRRGLISVRDARRVLGRAFVRPA
jgi:hypothetical protein